MAESEQETPVPPGEDPEPMPADEGADEESPAEGEAGEAGDTHEDPAEGGDEAPTG